MPQLRIRVQHICRWANVFLTCVVGASWCIVSPSAAQDVSSTQRTKPILGLINGYCVECHNATDATAGLNFEALTLNVSEDFRNRDTTHWEKVVKRLRARQMPPAGALRPDEQVYTQSLAALESILDRAASEHPRPGRTDSIRRLNRMEYHHAIRDLLAVDIDVNAILPADESGHGFDNVTVGELSPILLSRYIKAAEQISRLAVGSSIQSPIGINVRVPADRTQDEHVEGMPLGTRGGTGFDYLFPASGEYEIQLRLTRDRDEHIEGLHGPHDIDVLIDRKLVHRFTVAPYKANLGNKDKSANEEYEKDDSLVDANLKLRIQMTAGPHAVGVTFPQKTTSLIEIRRQPFEASFNRHRHPRREPALFEVSIVGPLESLTSNDDDRSPLEPANDTSSRKKIFDDSTASSDNAQVTAEKILRRVLRLAYRRPVTDDDLMVPMRFFAQGFESKGFESKGFESKGFESKEFETKRFEAGIESALATVLVNPYFLFRAEAQPLELSPGSTYQITDLELASRLSFFLWSSIPDEELLTLAEQNRLHEPEFLRQQVMRMLRDVRATSLVTNFAAQWLYLRNLDSFRPDMRLFPDFDDNLRVALRRETELLFESIIRDDRSVLDLINTDTTFLNERLAKHYGIRHVKGSHFRPVKLSDETSHRGGLLRQGSILAVTSYATRTSPTIRGHWILGNILGCPPPPAPPNVPSLKDKSEATNLTIRERLAEHRANPACASCHDRMDPVGFSLENFDAVGRWRLFDDGQAIDASGGLPDGTQITNFVELEASILKRPEMFVSTLTEKLLTFALGRGIESDDAPAVRKIVRSTAEYDYRFSSLITNIVSSVPFQMRVVE